MIEYSYIRKGDANVWISQDDVQMLIIAVAEAENALWRRGETIDAKRYSKLYDSLKEIDDQLGGEE